MALRKYFIHRCTIQRPPVPRTRDLAGAVVEAFAPHLRGQACRYVEKDMRVAMPSVGGPVMTSTKLLLPADVDVKVNDQVLEVILEDLSSIGPFTIEKVLPRVGQKGTHHLALVLEKVK